jgi:hypothetical protein
MKLKQLVAKRGSRRTPVCVSERMVGMKRGVWTGTHVYVSPAMLSLLQSDTE